MINFIKKYKPALIFIAFIVIIFFFANKFAKRDVVSLNLDSASSERAVEFIQLINRLSVIEFDQDFINRIVGDELKDYTVFVPVSRAGRQNPFILNSPFIQTRISNRIDDSVNNIINQTNLEARGSTTQTEQEQAIINLLDEEFNELEADLENDNEEINSN